MSKQEKARYWTAVMYPESMQENWETKIFDALPFPFAYCIHDKDVDEKGAPRKVHVHILLAYPNTTTYNNILTLFQGLGKCSKVERCLSVRNSFEYLCHNTQTAKKQGKHIYAPAERVLGNNFDIGCFEQLDVAAKNEQFKELMKLVRSGNFLDFATFMDFALDNFDLSQLTVVKENQSLINNYLKANFQRWMRTSGKQ